MHAPPNYAQSDGKLEGAAAKFNFIRFCHPFNFMADSNTTSSELSMKS